MNRITRTAGRFLCFVMLAALFAPDARAAGPLGIDNCVLWLDASQISGLSDGAQVNTWNDMSGAGNHATRQGGSPLYKTSQINGKPVVRFSTGGNDWFSFPRRTDIRTVFWVLKEAAIVDHWLLGDSTEYHFHRGPPVAGGQALWYPSGNASPNIINGTTKLMGDTINGTTTALGTGYRLVSVVTTNGPVAASQICKDRTTPFARSWDGDIAEIIIYNRALNTTEENQVGYYLKQKYGITAPNYTRPPSPGMVMVIK